jgi:hypothetical protein
MKGTNFKGEQHLALQYPLTFNRLLARSLLIFNTVVLLVSFVLNIVSIRQWHVSPLVSSQ